LLLIAHENPRRLAQWYVCDKFLGTGIWVEHSLITSKPKEENTCE